MAETAASLTIQLEALRRARSSGAREVEFRSGSGSVRRTAYRSDSELAAAIADLETRLAAMEGASPLRNLILRNSSGW